MTELPENAYLDFLEMPEHYFMKSLFLKEWRSDETTIYDYEELLTPRFLSDALSTLPERDENSFSDYYIDHFHRLLQDLVQTGPGRSMSRDLFELYMPTLPELNLERAPMNPANVHHSDPFAYAQYMMREPIDCELDEATRDISVLKDSHERTIASNRYTFERTVKNLLSAAWRGRHYEIVTGLPKLDSWLAEAQAALTEFTLPNGVADELINRELIKDLIRSRQYRMFTISGYKDPLIVELDSIPLTTVVGWGGGKLLPGITREDAVAMLDTYAVDHKDDYGSMPGGLGGSRDFLKIPEVLMDEKKLADFKLLTGVWRRRA